MLSRLSTATYSPCDSLKMFFFLSMIFMAPSACHSPMSPAVPQTRHDENAVNMHRISLLFLNRFFAARQRKAMLQKAKSNNHTKYFITLSHIVYEGPNYEIRSSSVLFTPSKNRVLPLFTYHLRCSLTTMLYHEAVVPNVILKEKIRLLETLLNVLRIQLEP